MEADDHPTLQKQRDKWVVRVVGIDTVSGARKPRQLGTYPSRRSARAAASGFAASGDAGAERDTVAAVVDRCAGIGGVRLDRLDRDDVARWLEGLASEGRLSRRSIQIMRMVLRVALADAVDLGELRRSPASRVGMPRNVAKTSRELDRAAWTEDELRQFLASVAGHRWARPIRLAALYGLRRSELLGLTWAAVDLAKGTVRIEQALVEVHGRPEWTEGKNAAVGSCSVLSLCAVPSVGWRTGGDPRVVRGRPS